jgi:hypothetical protein
MHAINFVTALVLLVAYPTAVLAADEPKETATPSVYIPIAKDEASPIDGIVIDEATAKKNAQQKIELQRVRSDYEVDKRTWSTKEDLYKNAIKERDEKIASQQSWWSENKFEVGVVGGVLVGAVLMWLAVKAGKEAAN